MNRPPDQFVRVQEDRLLAFAQSCFQAAGLPPDHAAVISRLLVNSDLRGVRSHGTRCVNWYCSAFEKGQLNPAPQVRLLSETPAVATLSGDGTLGYLPMVEAARVAVDKATRTGLGMVTVRHIGHYGSAGHYARLCMEAGCIGFSVQGHVN
ncbi:MAG: Ldh family oxidoreductase, partial [Gemmatimonadota bacterium]